MLEWAMLVNEKLTFAEYFQDARFKDKIPNLSASEPEKKCGDNIYQPTVNNGYEPLLSCRGCEIDINKVEKDLKGLYVLISAKDDFWYFGKNAIELPSELLNYTNFIPARAHHNSTPKDLMDKFEQFILNQKIPTAFFPTIDDVR
jgi:hypothetical protein